MTVETPWTGIEDWKRQLKARRRSLMRRSILLKLRMVDIHLRLALLKLARFAVDPFGKFSNV